MRRRIADGRLEHSRAADGGKRVTAELAASSRKLRAFLGEALQDHCALGLVEVAIEQAAEMIDVQSRNRLVHCVRPVTLVTVVSLQRFRRTFNRFDAAHDRARSMKESCASNRETARTYRNCISLLASLAAAGSLRLICHQDRPAGATTTSIALPLARSAAGKPRGHRSAAPRVRAIAPMEIMRS
uniref:Uncharacterized protein n=1 Tax=Rhodopseudomonas palustris (strain BisA53) TaxID=316055 RepID=Q07VK1_RHOP5